MLIGQGGRGLAPLKVRKAKKRTLPQKRFGRIPPAPEPSVEHFQREPERPVPIAVQAMQAIRAGEIGSNRSNFDRDFALNQYSLPLQGSDITPSVPHHPDPRGAPNAGIQDWGEPTREMYADDYRNEYIRGTPRRRPRYDDDSCEIPVKTGRKRFGGHTVTFFFGLALIGIVVLGFYFGKKKPQF